MTCTATTPTHLYTSKCALRNLCAKIEVEHGHVIHRWMRMPGKSGGVAIWWRRGPGSLVQLA